MYKVGGSDVVFTKIIEDIPETKDEIYTNILSYFAIDYKSANDVVQQKDKDADIVIEKGIFEVNQFNCWHTIRFDIKEGRVRVAISVATYKQKEYNKYDTEEHPIIGNYPFMGENYPSVQWAKMNKGFYSKSFIGLCNTINNTFDNIGKYLRDSTIHSDEK
ncbi:hypothetical protein Barb6_01077 [Bacteroidales bacterium Barb6]|nr:hypothetical protein Barb6_01077 [Bacteroidales bacterium Barb6]